MSWIYNKTTNTAQRVNDTLDGIVMPDCADYRAFINFKEANPPIPYDGSRDLEHNHVLQDSEVVEITQVSLYDQTLRNFGVFKICDEAFIRGLKASRAYFETRIALIDAEVDVCHACGFDYHSAVHRQECTKTDAVKELDTSVKEGETNLEDLEEEARVLRNQIESLDHSLGQITNKIYWIKNPSGDF